MKLAKWSLFGAILLGSCARPQAPLTVAAAANLTDIFGQVERAFEAKTGVKAVFSYGPTAELAQQIANGAPFDLFAAADTSHVDALIASGKLVRGSRAVYAMGELALWIPGGGAHELKDLAGEGVRFVAVAQPELAPYGAAAIEALKNSGLWTSVQPKLVYANSISQAKQLAASGNADTAFTAYSLVLHEKGTVLKIDPSLYHPIEQALAITASSTRAGEAESFRSFLLGPEGRTILAAGGYLLP